MGVYDAQDLQKKISEQCKQMEPCVNAIFQTAVIDGKVVLSAEIPELDVADKPCFYKGVGRIKGSYKRLGDCDEPMTEYEIYSFEAFRKKYHDEYEIVPNQVLALLNENMVDEYIVKLKV